MARRRKRKLIRKIEKLFTTLWRRRFIITLVLFLAAASGLFWKAIKWYENYSAKIAELEVAVQKAESGTDVGQYMALSRNLEFQRLEPIFWGLLVLMLLTFGTVLIVVILNTNSGIDHHDRSARNWEKMMDERRSMRQDNTPPPSAND